MKTNALLTYTVSIPANDAQANLTQTTTFKLTVNP